MKDNDKKYFMINICVERVVPTNSNLRIYSKDYSEGQIKYIIENFETLTKIGNKPINSFIPKRNPYKGLKPFKFESDVSETKIRKKSVRVKELKYPQNFPLEYEPDILELIDMTLWDEFLSDVLEDSRKNPNFDEEEFNNLKTK